MTPETPRPPEFVRLTNDQQELAVASLKATLGIVVRSIPTELLEQERASKRAICVRLRELIDAFSAPRCTIVTPGARRQEGDGDA